MAQQSGSHDLQTSKKRSHSSPELLATVSAGAGSSSDSNIQRILSEFSHIKENRASSESSGTDCCGTIPKTASTQSTERSNRFRTGLKRLTNFLGGKGTTKRDVHVADESNATLGDDKFNDPSGARPRSKSVCSSFFNRVKTKSKSPNNLPSSSGSEDSENDADAATLKVQDLRDRRINQRRKQKNVKRKSWRNSLSVDLFQRNLQQRSPVSDDESDQDSKEDHPVVSSDSTACSSDLNTDGSDIEIPPVPTPALHIVPVTLADMFRNHQQQLTFQRNTVSNMYAPNNPHVVTTTQNIYAHYDSLLENGTFCHRTVHTQIDYMHCLIPDQWSIINAPYYWGQINRFEADALLEGKPEGTFVLRDSTQEEFVFSVSFRRYGRTLHARIEQWNHKFTFDAHDPGVHSSKTICGLLEHYKDPSFCMFFEPMLTVPLPKKNPRSLQELCRARICTEIAYNDISSLQLPIRIREYLRVYHYKQRLRVRKMEVDDVAAGDNQQGVPRKWSDRGVRCIRLSDGDVKIMSVLGAGWANGYTLSRYHLVKEEKARYRRCSSTINTAMVPSMILQGFLNT